MAQQQLNSTDVLDFDKFLFQTEQTYLEIKQNLTIKLPSFQLHNDKFSQPFQNKYVQLSSMFDQMIHKIHLNFDDHKVTLQDQQQLIHHLLLNTNPNVQNCLIHLVSKLLINSQNIYQKWMNQEVLNLKQQLDLVILKNCQLQTQIAQLYQDFQLLKQKFDDELNNRFQLEKYCRSLEKEISLLKQANEEIANSNQSLIASMKDLDHQVQSTKEAQRITTHSELIQKDMLNEEKQKASSLEEQNKFLSEKLVSLSNQLQDFRQQQDNFIEQIKHLTEIIENQNYELDFYKGKDLRQSPSIIQHSFEKLNKYEDLLDSYQNSSRKGSLKSFIFSHQKSMGKLTIFEARQNTDDRIFQKISNPDIILNSYDKFRNNRVNDEQNRENFNFPDFNQLTFRPEADRQVASSEQLNSKEGWKNEQNVEFVQLSNEGQQTSRFERQISDLKLYQQNGQVYIEPLKISGKKHRRQRSQSITEGNPALVSKRLIYEEIAEVKQDEDKQIHGLIRNQEQIDNRSERACSGSRNSVYSVNKMRKMSSNQKLEREENEFETRSQLKPLTLKNANYIFHTTSLMPNVNYNDSVDNRSQTNSVNKALIKKNIRVQKEIQDLKDKLQTADRKVEDYEEIIDQMESQIQFYKHELTKSIQLGIRLKSQISAYKQEIENLQDSNFQQKQACHQKSIQLNQNELTIRKLTLQIDTLTITVQNLQTSKQDQYTSFEQRLAKVKQYCRTYIQQKHMKEIQEIQHHYQNQLLYLNEQLRLRQIKAQMFDKQIQAVSKRQLCFEQAVEQQINFQLQRSQMSIQTDIKELNLIYASNVLDLCFSGRKSGKLQCLQRLQSLRVQNCDLVEEIQPISINSRLKDTTDLDLLGSKSFIISQTQNQIIHQIKALHPINPRVYSICKTYSYYFTSQRTHQSFQQFTITNTINENFCHHQKAHHGRLLSLSNQFSFAIQSQVLKLIRESRTKLNGLKVQQTVNLAVTRSLMLKSPLIQKKQLLNTPSSMNTLETRKLSAGSHKEQSQNNQSQKQRNSPQNLDNQFDLCMINSHMNDSHNMEDDPNETFLTVSFIRNLTSTEDFPQMYDSFLTCLPFSSSQNFSIEKETHSNTQMILEQDVFMPKVESCHRPDPLGPLQTSQVFQTHIHTIKNNHEFQTSQGLQSSIPQIIKPQNASLDQNQFLNQQKRYQPLEQQLQSDLKSLNSKIDGYFPISLYSQNQNSESLQLYSEVFQRNLYQYFKKHTNFIFIPGLLPSQQIPNQQKMYILHTKKKTQLSNSRKLNSTSSDSEQTKCIQRFLIYKNFLLNVQTEQKLEIPNSHMLKFQLDSNKLILGNFQILITAKNELKITRNNKKCFYFGDIQDGTWNINKVEEITFSKPPLKK